MIQAWIAIHEEDLIADWKFVVNGKGLFNKAAILMFAPILTSEFLSS